MTAKLPSGGLLAAALAACAGACSANTAELTPLAWQKVADSPTGTKGSILSVPGAAGAFDEVGNFTVSAFRDAGITSLYYGGADSSGAGICPGINVAHWRIGLARSQDGVSFQRVPGDKTGGAILDNGDAGRFDSYLTYRPFVLKDGAVYRMWYNGSSKPFNDCRVQPAGPTRLADNRRIGYAQSTDGVIWTRGHDAPYDGDGPDGSELPLGGAGSIDAQQVGYVWVLKDGAQYKLYYSANDQTNTWRVALATSTDARHWTKVRGKGATGAVLDIGAAGSVDAACAYQPTVVKESASLYRMWYRACANPAATVGGPSGGVIAYAESNDGITWVKTPAGGQANVALVAGAAGAFDSGGLTTPAVFRDGTTWNMYYAGFDTTGVFMSGLARAPAP
jgi:hypothetical protein